MIAWRKKILLVENKMHLGIFYSIPTMYFDCTFIKVIDDKWDFAVYYWRHEGMRI